MHMTIRKCVAVRRIAHNLARFFLYAAAELENRYEGGQILKGQRTNLWD
jgi:hypothetical protein